MNDVRLMRHMGWDYAQLLVCPDDYVPVIVDEQKREQAEARAAAAEKRHGR